MIRSVIHPDQLKNYVRSGVISARVPEIDMELLANIAASNLSEAEMYQHVVRLIFTAADLRRRLEEKYE